MKRFLVRVWGDVRPGVTAGIRPLADVRPAERPAGRPAGRSSAAPVSSAAPKKEAFDRGGLVWPPTSNAADDRLRGLSAGIFFPEPKTGGSGGQRLSAKTEKFRRI